MCAVVFLTRAGIFSYGHILVLLDLVLKHEGRFGSQVNKREERVNQNEDSIKYGYSGCSVCVCVCVCVCTLLHLNEHTTLHYHTYLVPT